jgi:hypothetical protein
MKFYIVQKICLLQNDCAVTQAVFLQSDKTDGIYVERSGRVKVFFFSATTSDIPCDYLSTNTDVNRNTEGRNMEIANRTTMSTVNKETAPLPTSCV